MQTYSTEGVILQATNFQDYDQILTVFTLTDGLSKFVIKGANHLKRREGTITAPLTRLEIVYTKGRSEIYKCQTTTLLDSHLKLRQSLPILEAAGEIAQALLKSQLPNSASPDLYSLLLSYLEKLPTMADPSVLSGSYYLKILKHDGLLGPIDSFCEGTPLFTQEETSLLSLLAHCRSFQQLAQVTLSAGFHLKLKSAFLNHLRS